MAKRSKSQPKQRQIIELAWLCPNKIGLPGRCNHLNRGPDRYCAKCKMSRPEHVRFFEPQDARIVQDPVEIQRALSGPDWKCVSCLSDNPHDEVYCLDCGKLRSEEDERFFGYAGSLYVGKLRPHEPHRSSGADETPVASSGLMDRLSQSTSRFSGSGLLMKAGIPAAVLVLIWAVWFFLFDTQPVQVHVTAFRWERSVHIEKEHDVYKEGWSKPIDAELLDSYQKQSGTKQVKDGFEYKDEPVYERRATGTASCNCPVKDLGNGYGERVCVRDHTTYENVKVGTKSVRVQKYKDEPVMSTWYEYKIKEWSHDRTKTVSGYDKELYWPQYVTGLRERVSSKSETYIVELRSEYLDRDLTHGLSLAEWQRIRQGDQFTAHVNRLGGVMRIE